MCENNALQWLKYSIIEAIISDDDAELLDLISKILIEASLKKEEVPT